MGAETVIAVAALLVAIFCLVQVRGQGKRSIGTASGQAPRTDGSGDPSRAAEEPTLQRLVSAVRSLELQVSEHETLLCSLVTEDEARHLWNIAKDEPTSYERHPGVEGELRALVRRGLVRKRGSFMIHELASSFDIREHFELTSSGHLLLGLRKHLEGADTKPAESLPPRASSPAAHDGGAREGISRDAGSP